MTNQPDETSDSNRDQKLVGMMSPLKSLELQIGENVFGALQQDNTVAVLSIVNAEQGEQRIISVPLDAQLLQRVQELLVESDVQASPRVPCVGFHCPRPINEEPPNQDD